MVFLGYFKRHGRRRLIEHDKVQIAWPSGLPLGSLIDIFILSGSWKALNPFTQSSFSFGKLDASGNFSKFHLLLQKMDISLVM